MFNAAWFLLFVVALLRVVGGIGIGLMGMFCWFDCAGWCLRGGLELSLFVTFGFTHAFGLGFDVI